MDDQSLTNLGPDNSNDLFTDVLLNAIQSRASDIHFEPGQDGLNVRFRIDGSLSQYQTLETALSDQIISKIKVQAKLNISEHRLPQDGHFDFEYMDKRYNVRVSTLSTVYGEAVVLRILGQDETLIGLDKLGFDADQLDLVKRLINNPSGLILTTGPTGSGKTTLLYSMINTLNTPNKSIVTIEDPVELVVTGTRQTQVQDDIGLSFAKVMRSILRQDPNVIMLGEIRDSDTALITIQAALSGVLIFSTFHTYDVPALVTRFMEMGIYSSVVAQTIRGVISTRLMRKVCGNCAAAYNISDYEKSLLYSANPPNLYPSFKKGAGCSTCNNIGYVGRIGVFEVVYFDKEIRAAIIERRPATYLYDLLKNKKTKSLRDVALERVFDGVTTVEEFIRVIGTLD